MTLYVYRDNFLIVFFSMEHPMWRIMYTNGITLIIRDIDPTLEYWWQNLKHWGAWDTVILSNVIFISMHLELCYKKLWPRNDFHARACPHYGYNSSSLGIRLSELKFNSSSFGHGQDICEVCCIIIACHHGCVNIIILKEMELSERKHISKDIQQAMV